MIEYEMPNTNPFTGRYSWHGKIYSMDNTPIDDFSSDDLEMVVWSYETPDEWDGEVSCVCKLKDGRFVSWETTWGPTGDGFCEDAYGGDADILMSSSLRTAMVLGISEKVRPCFDSLEE